MEISECKNWGFSFFESQFTATAPIHTTILN